MNMKHYNIYLFSLLLSIILFNSCKDEENFDNKVYIDTTSKVNSLLIKGSIVNEERTIQTGIAQPENKDITITYKVDPSLVNKYNEAYYDNAVMLPKEHYGLPESKVSITAGSVRSSKITVYFKDINKLDRNVVYVLPVTIDNANIDILESVRTTYYVLKGAALINVVADIEENYLHIDQWKNADVVNDLSQLTMEALIKVRNFDHNIISTVMGIEGKFLIRLGDAGFPGNQIQIATSSGNFPESDSNKGLPANEWVHIALTYNSVSGNMKVYVNGKMQSETTKKLGAVSFGYNGIDGFYIGRSFEDSRYLAGEVSECRIWNIVRTQEQIADNPYEINVGEEGLVAYWKCDDGGGNTVKDHSGNGNDLVAKSGKDLKWTSVVLPSPDK